jgi:hypothetical protein
VALGERLNNYDTAYALVWAHDLADGRLPDYEVALAPTPHPLQTLVLTVPALLGCDGESTAVAIAWFSLLALGVLVVALGREWFGWAAGALAAAIVLTREPVLSFGLRAYVDLPYLCLLFGALLVHARRPREAAWPVLGLLTLAGLLRPEAWLFALAYCAWLWRDGRLRPGHVAMAVAAPVLWALSDLAVTGDPLWSLTGTQENADELGRVTGLDDVPVTAPRRLGEILREPVLLGAALGLSLTWWQRRERVKLPIAAGLLSLAAFCVLAAFGLPLLTRYLLAPAVLLALFCGAAAFGWLEDRSAPWLAAGATTLLALAAFAPSQADRLDRLDAALDRQSAILDELKRYVEGPVDPRRCGPLTLPNRRAVPQLALWTGRQPRDIGVAQVSGTPARGTYFAPASAAVASDFVLDRRDRNRRLPPPPKTKDVLRGKWWTVYRRCR